MLTYLALRLKLPSRVRHRNRPFTYFQHGFLQPVSFTLTLAQSMVLRRNAESRPHPRATQAESAFKQDSQVTGAQSVRGVGERRSEGQGQIVLCLEGCSEDSGFSLRAVEGFEQEIPMI